MNEVNNNSDPSDLEDDTKIINQTGEEEETIKEKEELEDESIITEQTDEDPITIEDKKELEGDLKIEGWDDDTHEKFPISRLIECALNFIKNEDYKTLKLERISNKYIGELIEKKFKLFCRSKGLMIKDEVGKGVDIDEYDTDVKSSRSSPTPGHGAEFKNYEELIKGLSYHIILFRYNLDEGNRTLTFYKTMFIPRHRTADHRFTDKLKEAEEEKIEKFLEPFINDGKIPDDFVKTMRKYSDDPTVKDGYFTLNRPKNWGVGYGSFEKLSVGSKEIISDFPVNKEYKFEDLKL
ncbi:MAG: hypothetical protein ACXACO_21115 [Promethearchaeota archaeon]